MSDTITCPTCGEVMMLWLERTSSGYWWHCINGHWWYQTVAGWQPIEQPIEYVP